MLNFDEGEYIFFDSTDFLSSEEPLYLKEDLFCGNLGYEIWLKEPQSVQERRQSFLRGMGFSVLASGKELDNRGLERIVECSGAVSSDCASSPIDCIEGNLVCNARDLSGKGNCSIDELEQHQVDSPNVVLGGENARVLPHVQTGYKNFDVEKKKLMSWWKNFINRRKITRSINVSKVLKPIDGAPSSHRVKVRKNKTRHIELSAVYVGQEIHAHKGLIWTMKFSPDGHYLASGGEDGVIRIWHVTQIDASHRSICAESKFGTKKASHKSVVIPDKVFHIEDLPLQEFHGHTNDVLDLAWSKSNCLLSSSKDKTVRLWQLGCKNCLRVFNHNDYVTCIQFNPIDEDYFISGSIDGKVRIWGVLERRVVDWVDVRDVVTATCYEPDGKGFIVGSIMGTCCFYGVSDGNLNLNAQIHLRGRKKSSRNRVTGIQFTQEDSRRVVITSEDSKVRILDGVDIVRKYRGLANSGSQMSASFTSTGRHIISVGEDSRVYMWKYKDPHAPSSNQENFARSFEHFVSEGVSVAVPWSGIDSKQKYSAPDPPGPCLQTQDCQEAFSWRRESSRFPFANCFPKDGYCRGSATWPEEKLEVSTEEYDQPLHNDRHIDIHHDRYDCRLPSAVCWGLVIVTAGWDGMIRTFHNYGLPIVT